MGCVAWPGRLRGRRDGWVVLLYHRVTVLRRDPWGLAVLPRHFEEHLDVIRRHARPTTLGTLDEMMKRGEHPRRVVVVTFDDGYADNLYEARPLLERYEVPATVFVTTGPLHHDRGFWWDALEDALLSPNVVPATLSLEITGRQREWTLAAASPYGQQAGITGPSLACVAGASDCSSCVLRRALAAPSPCVRLRAMVSARRAPGVGWDELHDASDPPNDVRRRRGSAGDKRPG